MSWLNNDGLEVKFGTEKAEPALIGEYRHDGAQHLLEIKFGFADLPAVASNSVLIADDFTLPTGAFIEKVAIHCVTDMDSTSDDMALSIGTIDTDRTSNADPNSIVDAATQTELNAGGENVAGWVGVLVDGAKLTTPKLLTWEVDNHAASAGEGVVRIYYTVH